MPLLSFTDPFTGGPSFYTGTAASSDLVPWVFPVAINGRPYQVDTRARFVRAFEDRLRQSTDDGAIPGEATINPQGLWRRAQTSWHLGAGQDYADTSTTASANRFRSSKGVDPWTEGVLSLLPATEVALVSTETNLPLLTVGTRVFVGDGPTLKHTTDLSSWSSSISSGGPAGSPDITALGTNGTDVYVAYDNAGVYTHTPGSGTAALLYPASGSTAFTFTSFVYAKGWVLALHDNDIHIISGGSSSHAAFYTHPNSSFLWVGAASGQNVVYTAGRAGDISLVYKLGLKDDGTGFDVPIVAAELPTGEKIVSINAYLGFIVLGTNRGVRFCTSDENNDLVVGPVIETGADVECGVGFGRFFWYGWSDYDAVSTGLGRLDFGQLVAQNRPAFASDLMAGDVSSGVQGAVKSVTIFNGNPVFSVAGDGVFAQTTSKVVEGVLDAGVYRWGIPDNKILAFVDLQMEPLNGSLKVDVSYDGGPTIEIASFITQQATFQTFDGRTSRFRESTLTIRLGRDSSDATKGPVLQRWQARAVPVPTRSELFSIPLLLHPMVQIGTRDYFFDVEYELFLLGQFVSSGQVVQFQIGESTYKGVVENVEWETLGFFGSPIEVEGTATVTLRSLA